MLTLSAVAVSLVLVLLARTLFQFRKKLFLRLPPGPKILPVIGRVLASHSDLPWVTYRDWSLEYGSDVLYLDTPGRPTIILNSFKAASELLERRSKNYSDRPRFVINELTGWDFSFAFMKYGPKWRDLRRIFYQRFHQGAVNQYNATQTQEVRAFLKRAVNSPQCIDMLSVSLTFTSIIFDVVYGLRVHDPEDRYVWLGQEANSAIVKGTAPGSFAVESFPWLRYLPAWFPGASARRFGDYYKPIVAASRDEPFEAAKQALASNPESASSSMVGGGLQTIESLYAGSPLYSIHETMLRESAAVAYAASVDTQKASIHTCFVALAMHPAVQRKAQKELDAIVGAERLPTMEDIPILPYIQAVYKEAFRWMPTVPTGVSHQSTEDDELDGYTIPAGSMIVPNAWAMLHDPEDYLDPEVFNPDRFIREGVLDQDVRDPMTIAFGFGRRICPGRHLAINTVQLMLASVLHVYDIVPTIDPAQFKPRPTVGLVSYHDSLPCYLKLRSTAALALIDGCSYDTTQA